MLFAIGVFQNYCGVLVGWGVEYGSVLMYSFFRFKVYYVNTWLAGIGLYEIVLISCYLSVVLIGIVFLCCFRRLLVAASGRCL